MKELPLIAEGEFKVWIWREDYEEFKQKIQFASPEGWNPAQYKITYCEDTNYIPSTEARMLVAVRIQFIGQTEA